MQTCFNLLHCSGQQLFATSLVNYLVTNCKDYIKGALSALWQLAQSFQSIAKALYYYVWKPSAQLPYQNVILIIDKQVIPKSILQLSQHEGVLTEIFANHVVPYLSLREIANFLITSKANLSLIKTANILDRLLKVPSWSRFEALLRFCQGLKKLNLAPYYFIQDNDLKRIVEACPNLEEINLQGCSQITDEGLGVLVQKCSYLKRINLRGCKRITNKGIKNFVLNCCSQTQYIDLRIQDKYQDNPDLLDNEILKLLFARCHALEHLKINYCWLSEDVFLAQNKLCLKTITLNLSRIEQENALIKLIQNSPLLERIEFTDVFGITEQTFLTIAKNCPQLKEIELGGSETITDNDLNVLAQNCSQLEFVGLSLCKGVGPKITDAGLKALGEGCPKLQAIDLTETKNMTDEGLTAFCSLCPNLKKIYLRHCEWLTNKGIVALSTCSGLQEVIFGHRKIDDATLLTLSQKTPDLKKFIGCVCTSRGLEIVAKNYLKLESLGLNAVEDLPTINNLRNMAKSCSNLKDIHVSVNSLFINQIMSIFQDCHKIEQISLLISLSEADQKISKEEWIKLVQNCPHLQNLILFSYENITNEDLRALAQHNRSLKTFKVCAHSNKYITDQGILDMIELCPSLQEIQIDGCMRLTKNIKQSVAKLRPHLKLIV